MEGDELLPSNSSLDFQLIAPSGWEEPPLLSHSYPPTGGGNAWAAAGWGWSAAAQGMPAAGAALQADGWVPAEGSGMAVHPSMFMPVTTGAPAAQSGAAQLPQHSPAYAPAAQLPPVGIPTAVPQQQQPAQLVASLPHPAQHSAGQLTSMPPPPPRPPAAGKAVQGQGSVKQPGGMSRQQMRNLQRKQREVDQGRIKSLEQQLGSLRHQLESLSVENQHLKQRQAALNATLEMQQQLQAAAATAGGPGTGPSMGSMSEVEEEADLLSLSFAPTASATADGDWEEGDAGSDLDESAVDSLLAELAASAEEGSPGGGGLLPLGGGLLPSHSGLSGLGGLAGALWRDPGRQGAGTGWFFASSLVQHVQWYHSQVRRLAHLLSVLDGIPPRLRRSLEDYKLHEETMDLLTNVLSDVDDWSIHMAALRSEDYGVVLHNNLQELLDADSGSSAEHGDGATGAGGGTAQNSGGGEEGGAAAAATGAADGGQRREESKIWHELVEELALTPQQEHTLEAHQALFEQRAAALEESKAAVLAALTEAAKRDDKDAAADLLKGAEALRQSLQQDMLAKAPTMISLRKVLTPLQMARLIVNCWPFYSTMKNVSRAHKQRRLASTAWRR